MRASGLSNSNSRPPSCTVSSWKSLEDTAGGRGTVLFDGLNVEGFLSLVVDRGDRSDCELIEARDDDERACDMVGGLRSRDFVPADETRLSDGALEEVDPRRGGDVREAVCAGNGADAVSGVGADASLEVLTSGDDGRRSENGRAALGD